jgi:serine beta-lactamase-like protein LACTB
MTGKVLLRVVGTIVFCCVLAPLFAQHEIDGKRPMEQVPKVRQLVLTYMHENQIPGISVAIVSHGAITYTEGFGKADLESDVPVTPNTTFPSASTLKVITATAVMQLAAAGKLDLSHAIQHYCPAYPAKRWTITVKQLLIHQGGLGGEPGSQVFNREHYQSVQDAVGAFASIDLEYEPGSQVSYSNNGYTLLACAIEGASGETYTDYIRSHILRPAGMNSTEPDDGYKILPHRSRGYVVRTQQNTREWEGLWTPAQLAAIPIGVPVNADPVDPTRNPGAAGYVTTPTDLGRFVIAFNQGKLLSAASREQMMQAQRTGKGESTDYGFGWMLRNAKGSPLLRLFGSVWNGSSAILAYPNQSFAVAISTNQEFQQPLTLANDIANLWRIPH